MQITIRSSNIIFNKNVGEYLTREEILKQAGISVFNDDNTLVNLQTAIVLGGGAFDGNGFQITAPLKNAKVEWEIVLPNGQKVNEAKNALTLQVVTNQADYNKLLSKQKVDPKRQTNTKLELAEHKVFTLGQTETVKPLPAVKFNLATDYDIQSAQLVVYPVIGNGTSVNKNLVTFGITTINYEKHEIAWAPKNQDLYPFGPADDEITSLVYAVQAKKYLPQAKAEHNATNPWGFDPKELIAKEAVKQVQANSNNVPKVAQADTVSPNQQEEPPTTADKPVVPDKSAPAASKPKVETHKQVTAQPKVAQPEETVKQHPFRQATSKLHSIKINWYGQPIKSIKASAQELSAQATAKVEQAKTKAKVKKAPKVPKTKSKQVKTTKNSGKGLIKFVITTIVATLFVGGGIYFTREQSLKPYQAQIDTIKQNQDKTNNLLDRKTVTNDDLEKAVKLLTTNANLIKQVPTNDRNPWRAMTYNELEHTHQVLLSNAKEKAKSIN